MDKDEYTHDGHFIEPLIDTVPSMGPGALADEYMAMAHNVENALRASGGVPGKDYTLLDLYKLAQPFVVELMRKGRITEYDYPADRLPKAAYRD